MRKPRVQAPRFSIADRVVVQPVITTAHAGKAGTVVDIRISRYTPTLDKYRVRLDDGLELDFWDIQLRTA